LREEVTAPSPVTCADCGRSKRRGEVWQLIFIDLADGRIYCPDCAEREFGEPD
jgi:hypothetical protein